MNYPKQNNVKIKEIPLKVKTPKKDNSSISIFIIIVLLLINTFLVLSIINKNNKEQEKQPTLEQTSNETYKLGTWKTTDNNLFIFNEDNTFYWYDSYINKEDSYYSGTYNYKIGLDALEELGYTEEDFYTTFGEDLTIDSLYSLNLFPNISIKSGQDTTTTDLDQDEVWWFLIIIKNDNEAVAYNKTLDINYSLIKY